MNVVPRSTKNTNGDTEKSLGPLQLGSRGQIFPRKLLYYGL